MTIGQACVRVLADVEVVRGPSREAGHVTARTRVAEILRADGWTLTAIASAMKRHHTSILYLLRGGRNFVASPIGDLIGRHGLGL